MSTRPSQAKLRADRIAAGLCRDCGKCPPIDGKVMCEACRAKRQTNTLIRNTDLQAAGLCVDCQVPTDSDKTVCTACMDKRVDTARDTRRINKTFLYEHFGCKCNACGETDIVVMTLDHVNGDGYLDKKSEAGNRVTTATWYAKLVKQIKSGEPLERDLQMLCFNCHAKKDLTPSWLT